MMHPPRTISGALSHEEQVEYARHRKRVENVKSAVDTKPPRFRPRDGKRVMMQNEKRKRIQEENVKLVNRILNANTPSISKQAQQLHEKRHTEKGRVMVRNMQMHRLYKQESIAVENEILLRRLINQKPVYSNAEFERHEAEARRMRQNFSLFERFEERLKFRILRSGGVLGKPNSNGNSNESVSLSKIPPPSKQYLDPIIPIASTLPSLQFRSALSGKLTSSSLLSAPRAKMWDSNSQSSETTGNSVNAVFEERDSHIHFDFDDKHGSAKSGSSSFKVQSNLLKLAHRGQKLAKQIDETLELLLPNQPNDTEAICQWIRRAIYNKLESDREHTIAKFCLHSLRTEEIELDSTCFHRVLVDLGFDVSQEASDQYFNLVSNGSPRVSFRNLEMYIRSHSHESSEEAIGQRFGREQC